MGTRVSPDSEFQFIAPDYDPHLYHDTEVGVEDLTIYEGGAVSNYAGGSNLIYIAPDTYYTLKALFEGIKKKEREEVMDATVRLAGIPVNFISASGSIIGYGVGFGLIPKTALVINPITMGAGLMLCIAEGLVDAISLKRQARFDDKFDFQFLSCLRNLIDYRDSKTTLKTLNKMDRLIERNPELLKTLVGEGQEEIVKSLFKEIKEEISKKPHLAGSIMNYYRPALEEIGRQALIPNLQKFRDEYLHARSGERHELKQELENRGMSGETLEGELKKGLEELSLKKKRKLARRIRSWMVDEASQTIDPLLKGIVQGDTKAIREGLRLADDIHAQSSKKSLAHILGIVALTLAALSVVALMVAMPVSIPYIIAGLAMTVALVRAGVFSGTLDSRGWTFEPQKMLPEFIRKRIFTNTPRTPEIKHQYQKGVTPSQRVREQYGYTRELNLEKKGFENVRMKGTSDSFLPQVLFV